MKTRGRPDTPKTKETAWRHLVTESSTLQLRWSEPIRDRNDELAPTSLERDNSIDEITGENTEKGGSQSRMRLEGKGSSPGVLGPGEIGALSFSLSSRNDGTALNAFWKPSKTATYVELRSTSAYFRTDGHREITS